MWKALFGKEQDKCKVHNKQAFWICYDANCSGNRLICKNQKCNASHQQHKTKPLTVYKETFAQFDKHFKMRQNLINAINRYKENIVFLVTKMVQDMQATLFSKVNSKYCSNNFLQIEKVYKSKGDIMPLLYQFEEIVPQKLYKQIENQLNERQKSLHKVINKQEINLDKIDLESKVLQNFKFNDRQEKIKNILPFKCDLKLKFKASDNEFLSKKMFSLNIRGPIILYVQSHKNMHFGGYSSIMFPKYQQQQEIQSRNMNAFLFSLDHNQILPLKQQYKRFAIKGGLNFGFGRGDILISDQCQKGNISWAQIGRAYKQPSNFKGPLNQWLGGASYFRVLEYQIYAVQSKRQK